MTRTGLTTLLLPPGFVFVEATANEAGRFFQFADGSRTIAVGRQIREPAESGAAQTLPDGRTVLVFEYVASGEVRVVEEIGDRLLLEVIGKGGVDVATTLRVMELSRYDATSDEVPPTG